MLQCHIGLFVCASASQYCNVTVPPELQHYFCPYMYYSVTCACYTSGLYMCVPVRHSTAMLQCHLSYNTIFVPICTIVLHVHVTHQGYICVCQCVTVLQCYSATWATTLLVSLCTTTLHVLLTRQGYMCVPVHHSTAMLHCYVYHTACNVLINSWRHHLQYTKLHSLTTYLNVKWRINAGEAMKFRHRKIS